MSTAQRNRLPHPPVPNMQGAPTDSVPPAQAHELHDSLPNSSTPPQTHPRSTQHPTMKDIRNNPIQGPASTTPPAYFPEYVPPSPPQSLRPAASPPLAQPYSQKQEQTPPPQQYPRTIPRVPPPQADHGSTSSRGSSGEWRAKDETLIDTSASHKGPTNPLPPPPLAEHEDFPDVEAGRAKYSNTNSQQNQEWARGSPTSSTLSSLTNTTTTTTSQTPSTSIQPQRPRMNTNTSVPTRAHLPPHIPRQPPRTMSGTTIPGIDRRVQSPSPLSRSHTVEGSAPPRQQQQQQQPSTTPRTSPPYYLSHHESANEGSIPRRTAVPPENERQQYSPPFDYDHPQQEGDRSRGTSVRAPDRSLPLQEDAEPDDDHQHHPRRRDSNTQRPAQLPNGSSASSHQSTSSHQHMTKLILNLPAEHGSPTPSSALIRPETDGEGDPAHQLTPRSPNIPLPHPSFFANAQEDSATAVEQFDSAAFQQALYAFTTGDLPQTAHSSRRLVGNSRQGYHYVQDHHGNRSTWNSHGPGSHANFDFDAWNGNISLSSPATSYAYARPAAPAPPTPYSATTAPTPAPLHAPIPQQHLHEHHEHVYAQMPPMHHASQPHWPRQFFAPSGVGRVPGGSRPVPYAPSSYTSSPFPDHSPFLPRPPPNAQSTASSPSHQPVPLPQRPPAKYPTRYASLHARKAEMLQRGESTEPLETESEDEGERTEGRAADTDEPEDDGDLWVEEDDEDVIEHEYHPKYIVNPAKRARKFMQKWDQLVKLFHEIDRSTDTTMMLLASPPLNPHAATHLLLSRSIQRNPTYLTQAHNARASFNHISRSRRREKLKEAQARKLEAERKKGMEETLGFTALMGRRLQELAQTADGVKGEEGLKAALGVALGSMKEMHRIYEERESRRQQEMDRQRQESAGIEDLLRQVLSMNSANINANHGTPRQLDHDMK